jgi:hypothetical protein
VYNYKPTQGEHRVYQIIVESNGSVLVSEVLDNNVAGDRISRTVYTSEENMPDDLRTKLAMLKLLTPPDGYEQVGHRLDDETFWIN